MKGEWEAAQPKPAAAAGAAAPQGEPVAAAAPQGEPVAAGADVGGAADDIWWVATDGSVIIYLILPSPTNLHSLTPSHPTCLGPTTVTQIWIPPWESTTPGGWEIVQKVEECQRCENRCRGRCDNDAGG